MTHKVIFINRYFYPDESATSQLLSDLAFWLSDQGWEIWVVTSKQLYSDPQAKLAPREKIRGVNVVRVSATKFGRYNLAGRALDYLSFYISTFFVLFGLVSRNDTVVAKTDPPLISLVALSVVFLKRAKLVNWLQDVFPEIASELGINIKPRLFKSIIQKLRNWSLKKAATNVVLGSRMRDHLIGEGIGENKFTVIPNWSSVESGANLQGIDELKSAWSLDGKFIVGYSGNLGRAHEFDTILSAAKDLINDDVVFLFIGDGQKKEYVEEQSRVLNLNNIIFKNYQPREQLKNSLRVPDVHLISLYPVLEGLIVPSKLYGIAAVGRPVIFIGDNDGEVARILAKHECGISVDIGDTALLVDTIHQLKSNKNECESMGRNAENMFSNNYTEEHAMKRWKVTLDKAI